MATEPPKTSSTSACKPVDFDFDNATDPDSFTKYKTAVADMLAQEKFRELDCLADSLRANKTKFAGGMWKIHAFYQGLKDPVINQHATEDDWQTHLQLLEKWSAQEPESMTARVALASSYQGYAWFARGNGYSGSVSDSGWQLFGERMAKSAFILRQASSLKAKCPEWFLAMQVVAQAQGWDVAQANELFEQAFAFAPDYYYFSRAQAALLLPKWLGEEGATEKFVTQISDRVGGKAGDILYFQLAEDLICSCGENPVFDHLSWPRIKTGFAATEEVYGPSLANLNKFALMAVTAKDPITADKTFTRIGDNWDKEVWGNEDSYRSDVEWTKKLVPQAYKKLQNTAVAEANAKTSEGAAYKKESEKKLAGIVRGCMESEAGDGKAFSLLIEMMADGTVEEAYTDLNKPVSRCVYGKLAEAHFHKQAVFSQPPHDKYWLTFDMDPAALALTSAR
ncbi:MAG: DUF4034 domain-containing protein [Acidobacteria bacterium]|nr:DUF4034 domain-containing protein [Acidobacteriota bacterium]